MVNSERKERDKQLRKADILKAAEHVFSSKGYHEAAIQDIAKQAQYGTGTVYLYFKDKNELYFSLLEQKMKNFAETVQEKIGGIADARKRLEAYIKESLVFFEQNQDFFRIYMQEKSNLQLIAAKKASESSAVGYVTEYVGKLIALAQKQGVIRKEYVSSEVADVLVSIMGSVVLNWMGSGSKKAGGLVSQSGFIFTMFLDGAGKDRK